MERTTRRRRFFAVMSVILLAAAGVRFRDWAEEIAGDRWDHRDNDFEKSFGVRQTANNRFILTRGHGWIAPALRGREIDGTVWNRLRFALRSTKPLRVKLLYQSSCGDNGVCRWLEPVAEKDGWSGFDVELSKLEWPHSSSPEAKAWGGRTGAVSMFAVDLYGDGIYYYECTSAKGREYLLFTLSAQGMTYEAIPY